MGAFATRGHSAALAFVERSIVTELAPHALLISGPQGIGKTTLALDLASGLLCLDSDPARRPCRSCPACRKVEHGNHPDLHKLAPEGAGQQIRVGQVQALASDLALLPLEGRVRIAIIEHADRLNPDAQNALLKTLEEPPARVCLVLAADDSAALLPTVISRCARLQLAPVATDVICGVLEEMGLADAAQGAALAALSGGRPGPAIALARRPEAAQAQSRIGRTLLDLLAEDRRQRLGLQSDLIADGAVLAAAAAGIPTDIDDALVEQPRPRRSRQPASPDRTVRRPSPAERRSAVSSVVAVWRDIARDLAVAARGGTTELRQLGLVDDLLGAGPTVDPDAVTLFLARLDAAGRAIDAYANPELALDALLIAWPHTRSAAPNAA